MFELPCPGVSLLPPTHFYSSVRAFSNKPQQCPPPLRHDHKFHMSHNEHMCRYSQHSQICASHYALLHNINNKTVDLQQQRTATPLCITAARLMQHHHWLCHSATRLHITHMTRVFSYCYNVHRMPSQLQLQQIQLSIATILQVQRLQPRSSWERVHLIYFLSGINTETQHYRLAYCPNSSNIFVFPTITKNAYELKYHNNIIARF